MDMGSFGSDDLEHFVFSHSKVVAVFGSTKVSVAHLAVLVLLVHEGTGDVASVASVLVASIRNENVMSTSKGRPEVGIVVNGHFRG